MLMRGPTDGRTDGRTRRATRSGTGSGSGLIIAAGVAAEGEREEGRSDDRALWLTRGDAPVDILFDIIDTRVNEAATRSVQRAARQQSTTVQGARAMPAQR